MAARSTWKGFLKLSLVSVPVKAFTAASEGREGIRLNQLHAECHSRVQYKKTCPVHGEIPNDQIVSGYEHGKDQYVIVDTDELDKLRTEDDKAITIDRFVHPEAIEPNYYNGKHYYLLPDGPVGAHTYAVLHQGMVALNRLGVAQVVFHGREQLVLLRPLPDHLLMMSVLNYAPQVTKPAAFEEEAPRGQATPEELQLVKTLIGASTDDKFDLVRYKDVYTEKLTKLIEAKVAGQEIVAPPPQQQAGVINLMEALKESVARMEAASGKQVADKPPKKMAPSKATETKAARKRKSS
jgi:DNA end-binding protein Ku